jgi:hypothetical protein
MVPLGYAGTVVTCAALGWPTPTIGWVRNVGNLSNTRMVSDPAQAPNSAYVSARLRWLDGFSESDAGNYTCVVRASDTGVVSSEEVSLAICTEPPPTATPMTCSMSSQEAYFQVRVLDTDCQMWGEDLKTDIARDFMRVAVNTVSAACQDCVITSEDIQVNDVPTCSEQVERAAIFRGTVSTESPSRTQDIFCALSRWQQSGPQVRIGVDFHLVDRGCSIELRSLETMECITGPTETSSFTLIAIVTGSTVGGLLLLLLLGLLMGIIGLRRTVWQNGECHGAGSQYYRQIQTTRAELTQVF